MVTLYQLRDKLIREYDPEIIVELLQLDSEEIVERCFDLLERDFDRLCDILGVDNEEEESNS